MSMICIQKNPKRMVRMPETGEELAEDRIYEVEDSIHWRRRIQSGDVREVASKNDAAAKEKQKAGEGGADPKVEEETEKEADEEAVKKSAKANPKKK